jgi:ankyrin repeat protein
MPARQLPARPDVRQLKNQAKDLLRAARGGDPIAIADFREYHSERIDPGSARLADAQLVLARSYRASSWPRLVVVCKLIDSVSHDDFDAVRELTTRHPELLAEHVNSRDTGWGQPMTDAANLGLRRVMTMLREKGARDVTAVQARPDLHRWLDTLRMLCRIGARPPRNALAGAVETLDGVDFAFMVEVGAEIPDDRGDWRPLVALALTTYCRRPEGKHRILDLMAERGIPLPDTPSMAVHRGRIDLLEAHLRRDSGLLSRTFSLAEIYPPELGCGPGDPFYGTPLGGATLLHLAVDYGEIEIARWLLEQGMQVDARAAVDADGFGGHTALFSSVVSYTWYVRSKYASPKPGDDPFARLLLEAGADPNARASLRSSMHVETVHEYRDVTPLSWGARFHARELVSLPAMRMIAERGGKP